MNEKRNFRILVADNDQVFLEIAEKKLSQRGFNVSTSNLANAAEVAKNDSFDFIFMDQELTETEGAELIHLTEFLEKRPVVQFFGQQSSFI